MLHAPFFEVDDNLCEHCGLCITGCVCDIIEYDTRNVPFIPAEKSKKCVHCGHCEAVCPNEAINFDGRKPGNLEYAPQELDTLACAAALKSRRSMRNFAGEEVDKGLLEKALALAAYAPTAHNAREVAYTVINGRKQVEKILAATIAVMQKHNLYPGQVDNVMNGRDTLFRGAPCLILIHAPKRLLSETDCATAAAYMELTLPLFGLASCWAGMFIEACCQEMPANITIPESNKLYAAIMVGMPSVKYHKIPYRNKPVVTWL